MAKEKLHQRYPYMNEWFKSVLLFSRFRCETDIGITLKIPIRNAMVAAAVISFGLIGCRPISENFQSMHIALHTTKVNLEQRLPLLPTPKHDFYFRFDIMNGNYSIDHFGFDQRVRYNAFTVDSNDELVTKSKYQALMQGPYGTVFAESTYFYSAEYHHQPADFNVALYLNEESHEPAMRAEAADVKGELSAVSLIRIFRASPGFLVACATYEPDGHLSVLSVDGSRNGNWVHSNEVAAIYKDLDVATTYVDRPKTRRYFGLPETFPVAAYLNKTQDVAEPVALASYQDVINLHYERNRYVRQDVFNVDGTRTTEFLQYVITPEDRELKSVEEAMKFGR